MAKLAVIGCGNMGTAIVRGLLEVGWAKKSDIIATNPSKEKAELLHEGLGIATTTDNVAAVTGAEVVLLGVKPQIIKLALKELRGVTKKDQLVISIAAGISTGYIEYFLADTPVVRSMPNLAVTVGMGATAIAPGAHANSTHVAATRAVFESVGMVEEVPEGLMDAVTGLSGTGPMYIFHVLEALADAGVKMGLSRPVATRLSIQTVAGAAKLAETSGMHPAALKDQVTSPGGTAITALHVLRRNAFDAILMDAVEAATRRSAELGE
jgi:pyrroline-5-carboxylate reductase